MDGKASRCYYGMLPKLSQSGQCYQKSNGLFVDIDKVVLKCIWRFKGPRIAKTMLEKENKVGGLTLPNFKTYC